MKIGVRTAMRIGQLVHRALTAIFRILGIPNQPIAERNGITYQLHLNEAIDVGIFLLGIFEPEVRKQLRTQVKPGQTWLDIGANSGIHTLTIAQSIGETGHVYAFEPTDYAFDRMLRNIELNPNLGTRITAIRAGLSDARGTPLPEKISSSWDLTRDLNDANPRDQGFGHSTIGAELISCDDWIEKNRITRVDGIKLDVDGFETRVLRGAERVLRRDSPVIILELAPHHYVDPNEPFMAGVELLLSLGYRFRTLSGKALPQNAQALEAIVPNGTLLNVIAQKHRPTV